MGNANPLRILFVDDIPSDTESAEREIRKSGLEFTSQRVSTKETFLKALEEFHPEVIVSDYSMPEFDGMQALKFSLEHDSWVPFILLLTGSAKEETAVAYKKAGASDYVIKENMTRLPFAVRDALEQKRIRVTRNEAERALHESEERYRTLITFSPDALYVHVNGRVTLVNPAMCRLLGANDPSQLLGKSVFEIVDPQYHEILRERLELVLGGQSAPLIEEKFIRLDGTVVDVEVNAVAIDLEEHTGVQVWARDITERKRTDEVLRESEERYRLLFESSLDGVLLTAPDGRILSANPAACEMLEATKEEICQAGRPGVIDMDDPRLLPLLEERRQKGKVKGELTLVTSRGTTFPAEITSAVFKDGHGRVQTSLIVRDITERRQAEDEIRESRTQLRALADYLQRVREDERTAIAREIHDELGQALTGIKMDLVWASARLSKTQKELRRKFSSSVKLVDSTIKTVRKISSELRPAVLDDLGLAAAIEWQAREFQDRTGVPCRIALPVEPPPINQARSTALFRMLQECLMNIIRHADARQVSITLRVEAGELLLTVEDDGKGISADKLNDPSSLGLLGMRERASALGGEVTITGMPRKGTKVIVRLPS